MRTDFSRAFWGVNRRAWRRLPADVRDSAAVRAYGRFLHRAVMRRSHREMYLGTFFLRNRPALELMRRVAADDSRCATLNIAILGCSIGVEVYSILWVLRSAHPELEIVVCAVDISPEVVEVAEAAVYSSETSARVGSLIFERLTESEMQGMFEVDGDRAEVRPWLREGIEWRVDDACDPDLVSRLGLQDLVVASNFLCHMDPPDAETCLRSMARLVRPGGHIFVTGVDLGVRSNVARDLGWEPVADLIEEIHDGDPSVRGDWPWHWWGLEPLDRGRPDWQMRYAACFRVRGEDETARAVSGSTSSTH